MGVREDCRHYIQRSTPTGEALRRCRISMNLEDPFACPDHCLFFEARSMSGAGWTVAPDEPMTNTADLLNSLPPEKRKRGRKKR